MNISGILQVGGLLSDIVGFSFLIWEVGFSHRRELLSNPEQPIEPPDIDRMKSEAASYKADRERKLSEARERDFPIWKMYLVELIISNQIARKYSAIEREEISYKRRLELASMPHSEAILKRRCTLISGAFLVILGFVLQFIGAVVAL